MRADEDKKIHRTAGDTDPILVRLTRKTDAGIVAVSNDALVVLRFRSGGATVQVEGVSRGAGDGAFAFNSVDLPDAPATLNFAIVVSDAGETYTIARGTLTIVAAI